MVARNFQEREPIVTWKVTRLPVQPVVFRAEILLDKEAYWHIECHSMWACCQALAVTLADLLNDELNGESSLL